MNKIDFDLLITQMGLQENVLIQQVANLYKKIADDTQNEELAIALFYMFFYLLHQQYRQQLIAAALAKEYLREL